MATKFSLERNGTIYENERLTASVFGDAIRGFCKEEDDYIILIPERPLAHSSYLQVHSPGKDNDLMPVEIRFDYPGGSFKHYRYETEDRDEIYQIFADYWAKGRLPDLNKFNDVSSELYGG